MSLTDTGTRQWNRPGLRACRQVSWTRCPAGVAMSAMPPLTSGTPLISPLLQRRPRSPAGCWLSERPPTRAPGASRPPTKPAPDASAGADAHEMTQEP